VIVDNKEFHSGVPSCNGTRLLQSIIESSLEGATATAGSYRKPISDKAHDEFKNIERRNAMSWLWIDCEFRRRFARRRYQYLSTWSIGLPLGRALQCVFRPLDDHRLFHREATVVLLHDFSGAQNVIDLASIATKHHSPRKRSDRWCSVAIGHSKDRRT
jgi:hypothetical protein